MYITHHLSFQDQLHLLNPKHHKKTHTKKKNKNKKNQKNPKTRTPGSNECIAS